VLDDLGEEIKVGSRVGRRVVCLQMIISGSGDIDSSLVSSLLDCVARGGLCVLLLSLRGGRGGYGLSLLKYPAIFFRLLPFGGLTC